MSLISINCLNTMQLMTSFHFSHGKLFLNSGSSENSGVLDIGVLDKYPDGG